MIIVSTVRYFYSEGDGTLSSMFQFSDEHHITSSSSRHPGKGNDTPPEAGLASGDEESIREKHHPREGLRGRFETNEDDFRRLSSLLLFDLQRHTRVLVHVEAPSSEEEECQNEELERRRILGVSGSRSGGSYKFRLRTCSLVAMVPPRECFQLLS